MKYDINILKGIHPGIIIERDLRRLNLSQKDLARKIGEYPSRITEIIKGRRKLNVPLSLKLEQEMGYGSSRTAANRLRILPNCPPLYSGTPK